MWPKTLPIFPRIHGAHTCTHAQCAGPAGKPRSTTGQVTRTCAPPEPHVPLTVPPEWPWDRPGRPFPGFAAFSGGGISLTPCPGPTCLSSSHVTRSEAYKPLPFSTSHRRRDKARQGMERQELQRSWTKGEGEMPAVAAGDEGLQALPRRNVPSQPRGLGGPRRVNWGGMGVPFPLVTCATNES